MVSRHFNIFTFINSLDAYFCRIINLVISPVLLLDLTFLSQCFAYRSLFAMDAKFEMHYLAKLVSKHFTIFPSINSGQIDFNRIISSVITLLILPFSNIFF